MLTDRDKLKGRIAALLAKTVDNGCTEAEALAAAAKVADLLDRYALQRSDIEIRASPCERLVLAVRRNKRMPLEVCVDAVAAFCDCRVWRDKDADGTPVFVFFGLPEDVGAARTLAALVDDTVRSELGRYKASRDYLRFGHKERHLVNASFAFGMVSSIADRLESMKAARDATHRSGGRDLALVKTSIVDDAFAQLGLRLASGSAARRPIATTAFEAGELAATALPLRRTPAR